MTRSLSLILAFGLGLIGSVSACDDGGSDDGPMANECGTEWAEKTDPTTPSLMDDFGAPCMTDADCDPHTGLGDGGGVCVTEILGVYQLPGGYCSRVCELPDTATTFVHDSPQCNPAGGVTCVGAQGLFTSCAPPCTDSSECGREGYGCRLMPTIASEGDPKFCLMNTVDCCTTDSGECGE